MTEDVPTEPEDARDEGREALLKEVPVPAPKKKRRWILRVAIALPVLLALFVFLLPTILSMGWVTRKIEAAAGEKLARRVTIGSHSVGWWAPVACENLAVYEKDGTTPFLKVDKVVAKLPLKPPTGTSTSSRWRSPSRRIALQDGSLSTDDRRAAGAAALGQRRPRRPRPACCGGAEGGKFRMENGPERARELRRRNHRLDRDRDGPVARCETGRDAGRGRRS